MRPVLPVLLLVLMATFAGCIGDDSNADDAASDDDHCADGHADADCPDNDDMGNDMDNQTAARDATLTGNTTSGLAPLAVAFTFSAAGTDGATTWSLDFGDGTTPLQGIAFDLPGAANHTYGRGTFNATFTVDFGDNDVRNATWNVNVTVPPAPDVIPDVVYTFEATAVVGEPTLTIMETAFAQGTHAQLNGTTYAAFEVVVPAGATGMRAATTGGATDASDWELVVFDSELSEIGRSAQGGNDESVTVGGVPSGATYWIVPALYLGAEDTTTLTVTFTF